MDSHEIAQGAALMSALHFTDDDLRQNEQGVLTEKQSAILQGKINALRTIKIVVVISAIGVILYTIATTGEIDDGIWSRVLLVIFFCVMFTFIYRVQVLAQKPYQSDRDQDRVLSIEGQVHLDSIRTRYNIVYIVQVKDRRMEVDMLTFRAFKEGEYYRINYTPSSQVIVSARRL